MSAAIDMVCMMNPAQALFRDLGRERDRLVAQLFPVGGNSPEIIEQIIEVDEHLLEALEMIEVQWLWFERPAT